MRRIVVPEPVSRAAVWSRRCAVFGLVLAGIAIVASRAGVFDPAEALAVLATAMVFGLAAPIFSLRALVVVWRTGRPGIGPALGGTALAILLLAYPTWLAVKAMPMPDLHDITTDATKPLVFATSAKAVTARRGATHEQPPEAATRLQSAAYPDVKPVTIDLPPVEAYTMVVSLIGARRWAIVDQQPPTARLPQGRIDAVARSLVMGFADDVTIRITGVSASQSRVDIRSASRAPWTDLGTNAARIVEFSNALQAAVDEQ
ncbi:DUF1499 domain-containing protein [Lichenihabitans psoromatis]|uniref:DUF1499 domain-containing protein n=1 Tax=Lichenihabitans psoromatis TaxID=2528642 RepID=UPI0013F171FA|nr:DUF1499 domain-containing protein [Lichenihabitans psoromatis]